MSLFSAPFEFCQFPRPGLVFCLPDGTGEGRGVMEYIPRNGNFEQTIATPFKYFHTDIKFGLICLGMETPGTECGRK